MQIIVDGKERDQKLQRPVIIITKVPNNTYTYSDRLKKKMILSRDS
jgi:hypothetical protein